MDPVTPNNNPARSHEGRVVVWYNWGGLRECDVADAILFPPRGIQAGNHPKYIIFLKNDDERSANAEQRLQMDGNGCQRLAPLSKVANGW